MKANKYKIFLKYIFEIVSPINLPKFNSISQILLKIGHFFEFSATFLAQCG